MACVRQVVRDGLGTAAAGFLELASEQRLEILSRLYGQNQKVSVVAREIDATVPEVFRNFERLARAGLISKDSDGSYAISAVGRLLYSQETLVKFLSENKAYLKTHGFADIPDKFLQRAGALVSGRHVRGFVKVLERWREIYDSADKYICNVLFEVPYTTDFIEPIVKKVNGGVKLRSVFSSSAIIPNDRKEILEKHGFRKMIVEGKVERRMRDGIRTVAVLNESKACIMFPNLDESPDISEGFYSEDPRFHEWCLDYFTHCWDGAGPFLETKLKGS